MSNLPKLGSFLWSSWNCCCLVLWWSWDDSVGILLVLQSLDLCCLCFPTQYFDFWCLLTWPGSWRPHLSMDEFHVWPRTFHLVIPSSLCCYGRSELGKVLNYLCRLTSLGQKILGVKHVQFIEICLFLRDISQNCTFIKRQAIIWGEDYILFPNEKQIGLHCNIKNIFHLFLSLPRIRITIVNIPANIGAFSFNMKKIYCLSLGNPSKC